MNNIYENLKQKTLSYIRTTNDRNLNADSFQDTVFKQHKIQIPVINKSSAITRIEKQIMTTQNTPPNISFTPGREMEYALFKVKVSDDSGVLKKIFQSTETRYFDGSEITCKEFSQKAIAGNSEVINEINEKFKKTIESIESLIVGCSDSINNFNEKELLPLIESEIIAERKRRNIKSTSENQLNPFN